MINVIAFVDLVSHLSPLEVACPVEVVKTSVVDDLVVDVNFLFFVMRVVVKSLNYLCVVIASFLVLSVLSM